MSNPEEFDLVVLGSGEAGKFLAWTLASQGQRAAVIERKYIGGSCPNIACLPSKNIIHTAKVASYFRRSEEFGSPSRAGRSTWPSCATASGRWSMAWWRCTSSKFRASGAELVMGQRPFCRAKDDRSLLLRWRRRGVLRGEDRGHQHRIARAGSTDTPGPGRGPAADARRSAGTGPRARAPDRPGRRLRWA